MRWMRYLAAVAVAGLVVACGGGGGSTSSGGGGGNGGGTTTPTVALTLVNSADVALTTNAISKGGVFYAKAVVANANGTPLANQLVTFTTDYTVATLSGNTADATALTDAGGVAKVLVSPLSLSTVGAAALMASATVSDTAVTATLNFSTLASNVTLANMALSPSTIGALETSAVTVQGLIDGNLATGSNVTVNFSASCGAFSPASVTTNSTGVASSTYQSAATCSGPVTLTSSAAGATSLSTTLTVTPARAANIVFSSATPTLLYVASAASGSKTSVVRFQVLDSNAGAMASQAVSMSLSNAAISAGVAFSLSGTTSTAPQTVTTDSGGFASIAVASGTLPTPLTVNAVLVSDATIRAASLGLTVTNGAPTQNAASFNAEKHSLEALNFVGLTTPMIFRVADRQANPVPDGTVVNFVASTGLITGSCQLTNSACTVTYTSQGTPPPNGRAAVLAYLDGEESFVDLNGDNIWQAPEQFYDTGMVYLDLNGDGVYSAGEQTFPGGSTGNQACLPPLNNYPSIANTCDGIWSANIRVRKIDFITWATSKAVIKLTEPRTATGFTVLVHDDSPALAPFNAMPTGTTIAAAVTSTGSTCVVTSVNPSTVNGSANSGTLHSVVLNSDANCRSLGRTVVVNTVITAGTISNPVNPGEIIVTTTTTEVGGTPVVSVSRTTATTDTFASNNTVTTTIPATAITVTVTSPSGYVTTRVLQPDTSID